MKNWIYIFLFAPLFLVSCNEEDELGESLIDTSTPALNEVDEWIRENYTYPFNVEVKYKWDNSELDNTKILTPAQLEDVVPFLDHMKQIWIDPYVEAGGVEFMKALIPKQIVLVGSHNYNDNGSITLGQAEGGRKITIFDLNYITFDFTGMEPWEISTAKKSITRVFKTMHHEFGHILHQTIAYPVEYKKLTTGYTSNWQNFDDLAARRLGFITGYSMKTPDEDFVEMLSEFLVVTNEEWNELIDNINIKDKDQPWIVDEEASKVPRALIRQKEKMLADYMFQVWHIDIYELQAEIAGVFAELDA